MNRFRILYRGSLSSCNYSCNYCPFAKTTNTRAELDRDAKELQTFVQWVADATNRISVFFTPWGEAIIHSHYRQAMIHLSRMDHVDRVAIQSNLSCKTTDLADGNQDKIAIWATYHPTQTSLGSFLRRCNQLHQQGTRFSVGVVGLREHFDDLRQLRDELPDKIYIWVNAYKRVPNYYTCDDLRFLQGIDPHFHWNRNSYDSFGKECWAGETVFTVNGEGEVHRCHFIDQRLGNIYTDDIFSLLGPSKCTNQSCRCHIGYVHLKELKLDQLYGDNVLERIPHRWPN